MRSYLPGINSLLKINLNHLSQQSHVFFSFAQSFVFRHGPGKISKWGVTIGLVIVPPADVSVVGGGWGNFVTKILIETCYQQSCTANTNEKLLEQTSSSSSSLSRVLKLLHYLCNFLVIFKFSNTFEKII